MRGLILPVAIFFAFAAQAQGVVASGSIDTATIQQQIADAKAQAAAAATAAQAAQAAASSAATPAQISSAVAAEASARNTAISAAPFVKSVNSTTPDANGAVAISVPTTSSINSLISAAPFVKTVNGASPDGSGAATIAIPTASTTPPPCIGDASTAGTSGTMLFAPFNHTHCSKVRKARVTGINTATYTWTYPTAFTNGTVPVCQAIVEDPSNNANDNYNVQIVGAPTSTQATYRIIRQSVGLLALLTGALSLNATPGTVNLHLTCFEP